jgi:hypothetical protein
VIAIRNTPAAVHRALIRITEPPEQVLISVAAEVIVATEHRQEGMYGKGREHKKHKMRKR